MHRGGDAEHRGDDRRSPAVGRKCDHDRERPDLRHGRRLAERIGRQRAQPHAPRDQQDRHRHQHDLAGREEHEQAVVDAVDQRDQHDHDEQLVDDGIEPSADIGMGPPAALEVAGDAAVQHVGQGREPDQHQAPRAGHEPEPDRDRNPR